MSTFMYVPTGSGNTWTRFLIDFATGVYSGTVFPREERSGGKLPGQGHCHKRVREQGHDSKWKRQG